MNHEVLSADIEAVGRVAIDSAMKVHMALGPGLLESTYEHCLVYELQRRKIDFKRQLVLPVAYGELKLDAGYRIDLMLADAIIIEIKSVDTLLPIHRAQLLTYMRLSGCRLGFLMNFNVALLRDGLKRLIL
jgi:GxxExxY protein